MKKNFRHLLFCLPAALLVGLTGCETEKVAVEPIPEIFIDDVTSTANSVTFTIVPEDAVKFTYSIALKGETGEAVTLEQSRFKVITKEGLASDKDYTITATAYSKSDKASEVKTFDFKTNPAATIAIGAATSIKWNQATVTLTPTNAEKFYYACYPTDNKPAKPEWMEEIGNKAIDIDLTDLSPVTKYTVEAYAENSHGQSEAKNITFTTLVEPKLTVGDLTATTRNVMVNVTPADADGFKYAVYTTRPATITWNTVETTEAKDLTIDKLNPNTSYTLEIFAYSATNGDGTVITKTFKTSEVPAAYITGAATKSMAAITYHFKEDPSKNINGYIYSTDKGVTADMATFLKNVAEGKDIAKTTTGMKNVPMKDLRPDTAYRFYVVSCTVTDGVYTAIPSTAQMFEITTPVTDVFEGGAATGAVISAECNFDEGQITAVLGEFSDNATICYGAIVDTKKEIGEEKTTEEWVEEHFYDSYGFETLFQPWALTEDVKCERIQYFELESEGDYKVIYVVVDADSKLAIQEYDFKAPKDPRPKYDNTISVNAKKGTIANGVANILLQSKAAGDKLDGVVDPDNKIQKVYYTLFTGSADVRELADKITAGITENVYEFNTTTGVTIDAAAMKLGSDTKYNMLILPSLGDNVFGKATYVYVIQFPYTGAAGTAAVKTVVSGTKITLTPDANTSRYIYGFLYSWDVMGKDAKTEAELVDEILSYGTWVDPAANRVDEDMLYGETGFIGVLAYDKAGKRSKLVYTEVK